jgi:hypothetical protein
MTAADHFAAILTSFAGAMVAWTLVRQGYLALGVASFGVALALVAGLRRAGRARAPVRLRRLADGTLCVFCRDSTTPVHVSLQGQTKLLGGSVYVDFVYCVAGRSVRCRRWITRFDVPAATLRRWTVVLPRAGRVANS